MHPRNIYKTPPNFAELSNEFPEFSEKIHVDVNGKLKLDFKDPEAVRLLTKCCLKKDFDLDIDIPPEKLLPTLPLRINYILWIEDLLNHCEIKDEIFGVDIGTGACCIYCLLAIKMNPSWNMFGLEIDNENVNFAEKNVSKNQLSDKIKIIDQEGSGKILERLFTIDNCNKTFTICNPPFFSSKEEMIEGENRTGKRRKLENSSPMRESSETVFIDGGEFGFVSKIFKESLELKDKIEIYSTMFGCKKNFQNFLNLLKSHEINNFATKELVQGKTYRWAVAWSFSKKISDFKDNFKQKVEKSSNVLRHVMENVKFKDVHQKLLKMLNDLEFTVKLLKEESNTLYQYEIECSKNTWSNQRKKKRAEKRKHDKISTENPSTSSQVESLQIGLEVKNISENSTQIQMFFIDGTMSKDSVNQILQFIKNNILKEELFYVNF